MTRVVRALACMTFGFCVWAASVPAGQAAGAMAIGACAAYGYALDYRDADTARVAAQRKCVGSACKVVVTLKHGCAAFAIDGHQPCGPNGYASAPRLGQAENGALQSCHKYGGKDCVIRAFACDVKG
jgi:Domain of unknown function (DUF4189)